MAPDFDGAMNSVCSRSIGPVEGGDRPRVGGVEDMQVRGAGRKAERPPERVGRQAGAAHARQHHVGEPVGAHLVGERPQLVDPFGHLLRQVEPAQPVADRARRRPPDRVVAAPYPSDQIVPLGRLQPLVDALLERARAPQRVPSPRRHAPASSLASIAASSLARSASKVAIPSSRSRAATASMSMPCSARIGNVASAASRFSSTASGRTRPWSRKAARVCSGIVFTVSRPTRAST